MKERPILFSAPMVRALLDGRKTQTRRALRQQPTLHTDTWEFCPSGGWVGTGPSPATGDTRQTLCWTKCPYGQPGDRLWVRETWAPHPDFPETVRRGVYRADPECKYDVARWRPSIHMPRWASRILLEVVSVRVERLQDISEEDAKAEGIEPHEVRQFAIFGLSKAERAAVYRDAAVGPYQGLWEQINGAGSWDANPFVWVIEFKRVEP